MKKIRALADLDVEGEVLKAGTVLEVVDVTGATIVVGLPGSKCLLPGVLVRPVSARSLGWKTRSRPVAGRRSQRQGCPS